MQEKLSDVKRDLQIATFTLRGLLIEFRRLIDELDLIDPERMLTPRGADNSEQGETSPYMAHTCPTCGRVHAKGDGELVSP